MSNFVSFEDFKKNGTTIQKQKITTPATVGNVTSPIKPVNLPEVKDSVELSTLLDDAKKQNGLIEKLADKIKNKTGFGISSDKIQKSIEENKDEAEIKKDIKNYRRSQENIAQSTGDVASAAAAIGTYSLVKQNVMLKQGQIQVSGISKNILTTFASVSKKAAEKHGGNSKAVGKILDSSISALYKKSGAIALGAVAAAFVGGFVKSNLLKINRIKTEQYKPQITEDMDKDEIKAAKKNAKKAKRNANFRNNISGAVNGLTAPVLTVAGLAGAPLYIAINSLNKYFIGSREDRKEKSITSYIDNIKSSPLTHLAGALTLAVPAFKGAKADKIFNQNFDKVVQELNNTSLKRGTSSKTSYDQLEDILFSNASIKSILEDYGLTSEEKIAAMSDENIFALKFKQIKSDYDPITAMLKESCPTTRTIEAAQKVVDDAFGSGNYTIESLAGVGTVAESYIVKDSSGKEFCIKMLKDGINADKINADKAKLIEIIRQAAGLSQEKKEYLIKNLDSIADGVLSEVDFNNEMKAASALSKVTKKASLVEGVKVSQDGGVYVMKKANGISLSKLAKELEQNPDYISQSEAKKLFKAYNDVLVEQFSQVDKNGKIIHGDIHPGNVFIDVEALKRGDKNFLTLIDTGNTINQTSEAALRFLNLTKYVKAGDTENITKFVLDGAILPKGMSEQEAFTKVNEKLREILFDKNTNIKQVSNDSMLAITDGILQKLGIISSDTQANLMKAKKSAETSMGSFRKQYWDAVLKTMQQNMDKHDTIQGKLVACAENGAGGISTEISAKSKKISEERMNLLRNPLQAIRAKRSKTTPARNSEEYITYKLKQCKDIIIPKGFTGASINLMKIKLDGVDINKLSIGELSDLLLRGTGLHEKSLKSIATELSKDKRAQQLLSELSAKGIDIQNISGSIEDYQAALSEFLNQKIDVDTIAEFISQNTGVDSNTIGMALPFVKKVIGAKVGNELTSTTDRIQKVISGADEFTVADLIDFASKNDKLNKITVGSILDIIPEEYGGQFRELLTSSVDPNDVEKFVSSFI